MAINIMKLALLLAAILVLFSTVVLGAGRELYRDNSGDSVRVSEQGDGPTSTDLDSQYACQLIVGAGPEGFGDGEAGRGGKEPRSGQIGVSEAEPGASNEYAAWFNFPVKVRMVMIKPDDVVSAKFVALRVTRIRRRGRGGMGAGDVIDYEMPFSAQITQVNVEPNDVVPRRHILFAFIEAPPKKKTKEGKRHLVRYDRIHGNRRA